MSVSRRTVLKYAAATLAMFGLTNMGSVAEAHHRPNHPTKTAPTPAPLPVFPGAPVLMVTHDHVAPTPIFPATPVLSVVFA